MAETKNNKSKYYLYIKAFIRNKYVKSTAPHIFSVLTIIILIIFTIQPTIVTIISLQKNITDSQQTLDILEQKTRNLIEGKRNLDNLDPSIKSRVNSKLPDNPKIPELTNDLQIVAGRSASISALQIQPVTIYTGSSSANLKKNLGEILFSFNVSGSYANLLSTLDNLLKSPRLTNSTSIIFSKTREGSTSMSVNGKAYYLKE